MRTAVCADPPPALGRRVRQREVEDWDALPLPISGTDRHDLAVGGYVHTLDGHAETQDQRLERHREVILEHGEQAGDLLVFVVTVNRGLVDVELGDGLVEALPELFRPASSAPRP